MKGQNVKASGVTEAETKLIIDFDSKEVASQIVRPALSQN